MTSSSGSAGTGDTAPVPVPTARRLAAIAAGFVLVPGLVGFVVAEVAGVVLNIAGVIGLMLMVVGMLVFPLYLRRVGRAIDAGRARVVAEEPDLGRGDPGPTPGQVAAGAESSGGSGASGRAETTP